MFGDKTQFNITPQGTSELGKLSRSTLNKYEKALLKIVKNNVPFISYVKAFQKIDGSITRQDVANHFVSLIDLSLVRILGASTDLNEINIPPSNNEFDNLTTDDVTTVATQTNEKDTIGLIISQIVEDIEEDLGTESWQIALDLESCENVYDLEKILKNILSNHSKSLSKKKCQRIKEYQNKLKPYK